MAKKSKLAKNKQRRKTAEKYADKLAELKALIKDPNVSQDEKRLAYRKIRRMPRDASATRVRNRCRLTGRPRGYYRKFGLSRIALRECALEGELPGVTKASW